MYIQFVTWHGISISPGPKVEVKGKSLPISLVAGEARGAVRRTFSPVDDKVRVSGQVDLGAKVHADAAPALKLVSVWGTVRHAVTLVIVVEAAGAGRVVVGFSAAAEALAVATLLPVCARQLAVLRAYWRRQRKMGKRSVFRLGVNSLHCWPIF